MLRPEPELPDFLYHAVVSEFAEALADLRAVEHGAADWAAWADELAREDS